MRFLQPTPEEIALAWRLGINTNRLNGPMLRDLINTAQKRERAARAYLKANGKS